MLSRAIGAIAVLIGTAGMVQAEKIHPHQCRELKSPRQKLSINGPIGISRPGVILLSCPFDQAINGYRVRYIDGDGLSGNSSVKVKVIQYEFYDNNSYLGPHYDLHNLGSCDFASNFDSSPGLGTAEVACPFTPGPYSYQAFLVELWTRSRDPRFGAGFLGIETF